MKDKVTVKKIIIQVGDKELALTPDAARELRDALNELLEKPSTTYVPYPVPQPYPVRPWRYWEPTWIYGETTVTCGTTGAYTISASGDSDSIAVIS